MVTDHEEKESAASCSNDIKGVNETQRRRRITYPS
jgi:hypothetical protein